MIVLYFTGLVFIAIPLLDCLYCRNIIINAISIEAIVLRTEKVSSDEGGYTYRPVFRYNIGEKQFDTQYSTGNTKPKYSDGERVQIYCHKKNPKKIILPNDKTRKIIRTSFFIIGIVLFCVAVLFSCITV